MSLGDEKNGKHGRKERLGEETFRVFHFHPNMEVALTSRRAAERSGYELRF